MLRPLTATLLTSMAPTDNQSYEETHTNAYCQNQDKTGFTVRHEQRLVTLGNTTQDCANYCAANPPCNLFQTYEINEANGTGNGLCRLFDNNVVGCNSSEAVGMNVYKLTDTSSASAETLAELTNPSKTNRYIDTSDKAQGDAVKP